MIQNETGNVTPHHKSWLYRIFTFQGRSTGMWTDHTTSVTQERLQGVLFFSPANLWFLTTSCLVDVYFQLKYTSPRSLSTPGISDVCGL